MPTYLYVRWKCFNCGTVNLSSGAGGEDVRGDHAQGGASEDRPIDSSHQEDELLHDQYALGISNLETFAFSDHQGGKDQQNLSLAVNECDSTKTW